MDENEEDNDLIDQVGEQLDEADFALILPLEKSEDESITCLVCGKGKCEFSFMTLGPTYRSWHGVHEKCAEPYMARKDLLHTPNYS